MRRLFTLLPLNKLLSLLGLVLFLLLSEGAWAATRTSAASGNWSVGATWVGGVVPALGDDVIIAAGHTVTLDVTTPNPLLSLTINAGGTLLTTVAFQMRATTITVNGTYNNGSTGAITTTTVNVNAGATYIHTINGATIPTATWNSTSNCNITGMLGTTPAGLGQAFGNVLWDNAGQTANANFTPTNITGNLEVRNSGAVQLRLVTTPLSITGNLIVSGAYFAIGSGAARTLSVGGNVLITGGTLDLTRGGSLGTLNVAGDFTHTGGTLDESGGGGGAIFFNKAGIQTYTSGGVVAAGAVINFTVNSGSTLQMAAATTVVSSGVIGSGGGGTFTLSPGATLGIRSTVGITANPATLTGNIQTATARIFNTGANYIYNGSANQGVGTGLPATVASLTIANTGAGGNNTVTLASSIAITNALTVSNGIFALGANNASAGSVDMTGTSITGTGTLTLAGNVTANLSATTATISAPVALGGVVRTFTVADSSPVVPDLAITSIISGVGGITKAGLGLLTLSGANTYAGTTTVNLGTLQLGSTSALGSTAGATVVSSGAVLDLNGINYAPAEALTLNGTGIASGGALINSNATTAIYAGDIALGSASSITATNGITLNGIISSTFDFTKEGAGTLSFGSNPVTLNNFIVNAGTLTSTAGTLTISGAFTNSGAFNNNGGTVNYNGASQTIVNVVYNNLTTNQSSGEAVLAGATTVNGTLALVAGRLNIGANVLTLGAAATISVASPSSSKMIVASGGSDVRKIFNAPASFTFPIGDNTGVVEYSPITINVTAGGGFPSFVGTSVVNAKHPNNGSPSNFLNRYWNVNTGITGCTATITGTYPSASINGTEASISTGQLNGVFNQTTNPWIKFGALGGNTLTASGALINAGQTCVITGIEGSNPLANAGADKTICDLTNTTLGGAPAATAGAGGYLYSWLPVTGLNAASLANPIFTASGTASSVYTLTVTDANGLIASDPVNVVVNARPTPVISGTNSVCANQAGLIYTTPGTGNTYAWAIAGGAITAGGGTNSVTVTWNGAGPGTLQLTETIGTCSVTTPFYNITINPNPTPVISGTTPVCANQIGVVYSTPALGGRSYAWTVTGGTITSGAGTNSITVSWGATGPGNVQLTETITASGCSTIATAFPVTINPLPTPVISGTNSVCANQAGLIYTTPGTGNTYAWTIPGGGAITAGGGTNSVTVTWNGAGPGTLQLTETIPATLCFTVTPVYNITINPLPSPSISGPTPVCANASNVTYLTPVLAGRTYSWSVTGGAINGSSNGNSVLINWGAAGAGTLQVTETITSTGCVTTTLPYSVSINSNPTPLITGLNAVCANQSAVTYTSPNIIVDTYAWSVIGGTIASGGGTSAITVNWGPAGAGTVQLTQTAAGSLCPTTTPLFNVTINPNPAPSISGSNAVCANSLGVAYSTPAIAGRTYLWTVTGGTISGSATNNTVSVNWGNGAAGTLQVSETITSTSCQLTTPVYNVTINPNPAPVISGPLSACANQAGVIYTTPNVGGNTYFWTISSGTITAGQNTNQITVTWGVAGARTVNVAETITVSTCAITSPNYNVTVNPNPTPVIVGSPSVCASQNGVGYSTTANVGSTYLWTVAGGTIASGAGTANITVNWGVAGSGTVQVKETASTTCFATTPVFNVTINPNPSPIITGLASVCANQSGVAYSVLNVLGDSYAWSVTGGTITSGAGTNSVLVTWGAAGPGVVSLTETISGSGCTTLTVPYNVTINLNPTPSIVGSNTVCENQTSVAYGTAPAAGRTYTWTIIGGSILSGAGTANILVNWGSAGAGTVQLVEAISATSCSVTTPIYNVSINARPTPVIGGAATVCANQAGVSYTTANVVGDINVWSVSGGTIISGSGTNLISVNWGTAGAGLIALTEISGSNGCVATASPYPITINAVPSPVITGNNTVCENDLGKVYSVSSVAGNSYSWVVAGGTISGASTNNSVAINWNAAGAGTIQLTQTSALGCPFITPLYNVVINSLPNPVISGLSLVCANQNGVTYSTPNNVGDAYTWSVSGGSIVAGAGTNLITVNWNGTGTGSVSLTETTSASGCAVTATPLSITINPKPTPSIVGDNAVCANEVNKPYSTPLVGSNTYSWFATGGIIVGPSIGNSIIINWGGAGAGTVSVTEKITATGCLQVTPVYNVVINPTPTPVITGAASVCTNQTGVTYSTPNVAGNFYGWTVAGGTLISGIGTNSIVVNWGGAGAGTVTLTEFVTVSGCAVSLPPYSVIINPIPTPFISGNNTVCANDLNKIYTTPFVVGHTYSWAATGGTINGSSVNNSVAIDWGAAGPGTLQLTETITASSCFITTPVYNVIINNVPSPSITGSPTVCALQNGVNYSTPNVVGNSYTWVVVGGTIVSGVGTNSILVNWGGAGSGSVKVTEFIPASSCLTTTTPFAVTINPIPSPSITGNNNVCANDLNKIYSTPFTVGNTYSWIVTGGVISGSSTNNTVAVDWGASGTGTLQVTETAGCFTTTPIYSVTINANPTPVNSGSIAVCSNESGVVYSTPNVVGNSYFWSVSGGSITAGGGTHSITVTWGGTGTGAVILTETILASGCSITTPTKLVTISPGPLVNAGVDAETCAGIAINLNVRGAGIAIASNFISLTWSGGAGTFSSTSIANPIYTPAVGETGAVTLSLAATGIGTCLPVVDQMILTITPMPLVNAGSDAEVCQGTTFGFFGQATPATASNYGSVLWTKSGGTGTIFNANTLTPTYQPSVGEFGIITFTLTANSPGSCVAVADNMQLTITKPPVVNAGSDQEVCRNTTFNFSTQTTLATATNFSTIAWTTTGSGTFSNTSTLTPTYIPGIAESGAVTFTLTATGNGSCVSVQDQMTLTVTPQVVVNAGSNAETCKGVAINFGTRTTLATASNFNTLAWSTGGTGTILNGSTLSPTYTPGAAETGTVTFTLTATGNGSCALGTSTMQLTITPSPTVNAGSDQQVCRNTTFNFSTQTTLASATNFNTIAWTTTGIGTFSNTNTLTPTYIPGALESGAVTFTLTATGNGSCATIQDQMVLTVTPQVVVNAGSNAETCKGVAINFGTRGTLATAGNFSTLSWSGGAGTILNGSTLSPTYVPGIAETGTVVFTLTATGNGSCTFSTSTMQLTITPSPTVNAGSDQEVCRGTTFNFSTQSTIATAANFSTIAWTTTGSGTFSSTSTLTPTYIPGIAESGAVTFTLTATGNGSCVSTQDQMVLTVTPQVVVNAGSNAETCKGISINFGTRGTLATAGNFSTLSWSGGAGTITNGNTLNPTYAPGVGETGVVTFTLKATGNGSCAFSTSTMQLTITPSPTVNAGSDQEVCRGTTFNFSTQSTIATAANFSTIAWTTTGSGTFTNTSTLTPTYVPGIAESGAVTFTLTVTGNGSCVSAQDQMVLTVTPPVVANAGSDAEVCQGTTFGFFGQATPATASNYGSVLWTKSGGTGTIFNANTLTPTYQPGVGEFGIITFTLTANSPGSCVAVADNMQLTITKPPVVNAGSDQEVCRGTTFNFSAQATLATAANFNTIAWTTTGSGTFTNASTLTPTYVPGIAESGAVTFTLTATGNGSCVSVQDQMVLTVTPQVVVNAGSNAETCKGISINFGTRTTLATAGNFSTLSWSGGAGTITNGNTLNPTYTPGVGETGVVTFTLKATGNGSCTFGISSMQLTITPSPTVNAGSDQEVCRNTTFNFSSQATLASATNFSTIAWTTTGSGTFTNTSTLAPTYVPGIAESGAVTFTLTATGNGSCVSTQDQMILTVTPQPVVNAGSNAETCKGVAINFGTRTTLATASNFNTLAWSTGGTGTILNGSTLSPTYTPGAAETGTVTFTLKATGNGSCAFGTSTMQLTITPSPTVNAGSDQEVCRNTTFNFSTQATLATATNFSTIAWTTTGSGTFSNASTLAPTYVPGIAESGAVTFTLTATGNGSCATVQDQMILTISPTLLANAGSDQEICQDGIFNFTSQSTPASASNFSALSWTHTGSGTLFNPTSLTPVYQSALGEIGNVIFTLTANGFGSCATIIDAMQLTIRPAAIVNAGTALETCQGVAINFASQSVIASASNYSSLLWTHSGTGTIANGATLSPTYTPGLGETGNVTFTLTAAGLGVCPSVQSQMILSITPSVVVDAGSNLQMCQAGVLNFSTQTTLASAANYSSLIWTHSGLGSLFNATTLTPTYFASLAETGNVVFTLKVFSTGSCVFATDITTVNIVPAPVSDAGGDAEVCEGSPTFDLSTRVLPANAANGTLLWAHNGAGSLSSTTALNPIYTLAAADFGNLITFTLQVTSGAAVCSPVQDQFVLKVNRTAIVMVPASYTICETNTFPLTGNIGGTATTALWSIVSGNGALSATNVTGLTATVNYTVAPTDVGTTVTFRLTSNDPDGPLSPCTPAFADVNVTINRAASITAGIDLVQCKDQTTIALQGVATYAPNGVLWSGGAGVYSANTIPTSTYSFANPFEISSTSPVTLTLTGLDPDGAGPCAAVSDQMRLTIHPLPLVGFFGLPPVMAENNAAIILSGNQSGGRFTIAPITSNIGSTVASPLDKASFDPASVSLGLNTVTYTFRDANGCTNLDSKLILINPVTTVQWVIDGSKARQSPTLEWELCAGQGDIQFFGSPPATGPFGTGIFSSGTGLTTGSTLTVFKRGPDYFIDSNTAVSDTYVVAYAFTNTVGAVDSLRYFVKVFGKPTPAISQASNCIASAIPLNGSVTTPSSPFPPDPLGNSWNWNFGDGTLANGQNVTHTYSFANVYTVTLTVTTSQGCANSVTKGVRVGDVPIVNYKWSAICTNDKTNFKDLTKPGAVSTITNYTWDFGDGDILTGATGGTVPVGTHSNRTGGTYMNPLHNYSTPGAKTVTLTVDTNDGCSSSITQPVTILIGGPTVAPNSLTPYFNDFNIPDTDWFSEPAVTSGVGVFPLTYSENSWLREKPLGSTISTATSTDIAWWTGKKVLIDKSSAVVSPTYYDDEDSWVNGPCFDLTKLQRPMISFDYWSDTENIIDGAVLQYSIDGGLNWQLIGPLQGLPSLQRDQGINWYDPNINILSNPGQQLIPYGWTGKSTKWKNGRFNLDMVDTLMRSQVRIRVAFGTNKGNGGGAIYDGFAFDNFFIGEKKRNVLIEHFTNSSLTGSLAADSYLNGLYDNEINLRGIGDNDFNGIQYHISYSTATSDQLNADNPNDPNARASSYGVSQPPKTFMDGVKNQKFDGTTIKLTNTEIDRRALKDPKFQLKLDTIATGKNNFINVQLTMTADTIVNVPLIAQVALVEDNVVIAGQTYKNVLRKLLFGSDATKPDGITITQTFTLGQTAVRPQPATEVEVNVPIQNPRNLKLIGFIQDKNTGEIYQSAIMKVKYKINSPITGIEGNAVLADLKDLQIYPNPANGKFNFALPGNFPSGYVWKIADQRGIFVMKGDFDDAVNGIKTVDVSSVTNGVYFVLIGAEGKVPVYRKLVVMNQN
jgi:hypothetical protein